MDLPDYHTEQCITTQQTFFIVDTEEYVYSCIISIVSII